MGRVDANGGRCQFSGSSGVCSGLCFEVIARHSHVALAVSELSAIHLNRRRARRILCLTGCVHLMTTPWPHQSAADG